MHRLILATAILLLAPATALAVTTSPAQPPTISITGPGVAQCTKLPYNLQSLRHKVILRITRSRTRARPRPSSTPAFAT